MIMKTLHFGIEMEMTGITRSRAASLMKAEPMIPTPQGMSRDGNGKP